MRQAALPCSRSWGRARQDGCLVLWAAYVARVPPNPLQSHQCGASRPLRDKPRRPPHRHSAMDHHFVVVVDCTSGIDYPNAALLSESTPVMLFSLLAVRMRCWNGSSKCRLKTTSTTEVKFLLRQNKTKKIDRPNKIRNRNIERPKRWRRGGFCDSSSSPINSNQTTFHTLYQSNQNRIKIALAWYPPARIISLDCHAVRFACCPPHATASPRPRERHACYPYIYCTARWHTFTHTTYIVHQHERGFS